MGEAKTRASLIASRIADPQADDRCGNCSFWIAVNKGAEVGECHRGPNKFPVQGIEETITAQGTQHKPVTYWQWARYHLSEWCGEHVRTVATSQPGEA